MTSTLKLLAASAAIMFGAGSATAADITGTSAGYDWSGPYIGAHAGYLWGEADVTYDGEDGGGDLDGFWGGALAGYNYQRDAFVLGLEGDVGFGSAGGNGVVISPPPLPPHAHDYTYTMDWNAHLRARAGLAVDKLLFFVTGGLAAARHELGVEEQEYEGDDSQTHYGWTLGGGVEYAVTDNLLLRAEYLYDDYGSKNYRDDEGEEYDVDLTAHTVRAAVSFKF